MPMELSCAGTRCEDLGVCRRNQEAAMQSKEPVASACFLAFQFQQSESRSTAVRFGWRSTRSRQTKAQIDHSQADIGFRWPPRVGAHIEGADSRYRPNARALTQPTTTVEAARLKRNADAGGRGISVDRLFASGPCNGDLFRGQANRSMVDGDDFVQHCHDMLQPSQTFAGNGGYQHGGGDALKQRHGKISEAQVPGFAHH